jgi:hypothetical protein
MLFNNYGFKCKCEACTNDYPFDVDYELLVFGCPVFPNLPMAEYKENYKMTCKMLESSSNRRHVQDIKTWSMMDINEIFRAAIGKNEPFIF